MLLLRFDEALHGREIARRTGLAVGNVTRELTKLAKAGLLNREKRGNQQVYSANTAPTQRGLFFPELASILRKTSQPSCCPETGLARPAPTAATSFRRAATSRCCVQPNLMRLTVGSVGKTAENVFGCQLGTGRHDLINRLPHGQPAERIAHADAQVSHARTHGRPPRRSGSVVMALC